MRHFKLDRFQQLVFVDDSGHEESPVQVVRAFPLTTPDADWAIVNALGQEIHWIASPTSLDPEDRALLEHVLKAREFCPELLSIDAVESFSTPSCWHITTSAGQTTLVLQAEEDIRRLPDRSLLVTDRSGTQYRIPDRLKLDRASRKLLDRFL